MSEPGVLIVVPDTVRVSVRINAPSSTPSLVFSLPLRAIAPEQFNGTLIASLSQRITSLWSERRVVRPSDWSVSVSLCTCWGPSGVARAFLPFNFQWRGRRA